MLDLKNNLAIKVSVAPLIRNANATVNGSGVDLTGYEGALMEFTQGLSTDGSVACSMEDSPDNSAWTAVAAADCINGVALATLATTEDSTVETLGYIGKQKWIRAVTIQSGATTGATFGANVILGHARHAPVTQLA